MSTLLSAALNLSPTRTGRFAEDVRRGLGGSGQKWLPATYLYDAVGSALFEAITQMPEYGLTRADEAILRDHAAEITARLGTRVVVAELGSGSGTKTRSILTALRRDSVAYYPIDVSPAALGRCARELSHYAEVRPIEATFLEGLDQVVAERVPDDVLLVLFLGSTIGNFSTDSAAEFLSAIRHRLRVGDRLLIGADLVKPVDRMLLAYDDPAGVTAAFNRNVLARVNRELDGNLDLRAFAHEARWNERDQRIEMHLQAMRDHAATIRGAGLKIEFRAGETIWTESSHKFSQARLAAMAATSRFKTEAIWVNREWPFAECLWSAF